MLDKLEAPELSKLMSALLDMSNSMMRVEAERALQKNVRNDICEELDLNKKVFTKLAKTYHKQNFSEEVQLHQQFEKIYGIIDTKST
jgi:hypothetical protein